MGEAKGDGLWVVGGGGRRRWSFDTNNTISALSLSAVKWTRRLLHFTLHFDQTNGRSEFSTTVYGQSSCVDSVFAEAASLWRTDLSVEATADAWTRENGGEMLGELLLLFEMLWMSRAKHRDKALMYPFNTFTTLYLYGRFLNPTWKMILQK